MRLTGEEQRDFLLGLGRYETGDSAPKTDAGKIYRKAAATSTQTTEEPEGGQRRTTDLQGSRVGDKRTYPDGSNPHMDFAACDWWEETMLFTPSAKLVLLLYPRH